MNNMITDPLFLLGLLGMTISVVAWIRFNLQSSETEPFVIKYLSFISFTSAIALLLSIFYNSGDLGIVLLFGSIFSLIVLLLGVYFANDEIINSSRGYFIPLFLIFVRISY